MDRPIFSNPRLDTVLLKVDAPYAANKGMLSAIALLSGGG
jgi:hypothetical protein